MYWIITLLAISVITFVLTIVFEKLECFLFLVTVTCCIFSTLALVIISLGLIDKEARFNETVYKYESLRQVVESYKEQDYGNMIPISEAIISMNEEIAMHKAQCNSKWTNLWYSEKIGNLEPLSFNMDKKGETSDIQK